MGAFDWITQEFVDEQRRDLPIALQPSDCAGKTYIVTGSNIGVGRGIVEHLVRFGATRVIMAVRNVTAGEEAKKEIEQATGKKGIAVVWQLDLAKWESVRAFARRADEELDRVDGLVENAAIALDSWSWSENHETSIKVNVLSTMLLGVLMMPKMVETGKRCGTTPHIVQLSSSAGFELDAEVEKVRGDVIKGLDEEGKTKMDVRYGLSKTVHVLAALHFTRLYPASRTGVVVNLLSPGLVKSGLTRHGKLATRAILWALNARYARTPEMAGRTALHALQAGEESHGSYLSDCKIKKYVLRIERKKEGWMEFRHADLVFSNYLPEWIAGPDGQKLQQEVWGEVAVELEKASPGCLNRIP